MSAKYWRVVCRYGHVGKRKEVSVSRYIATENSATIIDVMNIVNEMPGVKNKGVLLVEPISEFTYTIGKEQEKGNLYLQRLMTYQINNGYGGFTA